MVVVKTEDEACGGPLRFYPLRPDELIDAGNRTKVLDIVVSPAINCKSCITAPPPGPRVWDLVQIHLLSLHSWGVCDGNAVLPGDLPFFLPAHFAGCLCREQTVRHLQFLNQLIRSVDVEPISKIESKVPFWLLFLILPWSAGLCRIAHHFWQILAS